MNTSALDKATIMLPQTGDGNTIQEAIDKLFQSGGGRIIIPRGIWHTGTIWLKSHIELHLEKGAVLKASVNEEDYNKNEAFPENFWSAGEEWSGSHLILGYKVEDVAITGKGIIDGSGSNFFGDCDFDSFWPFYKYGLKLHPTNPTRYRPGPMVAFFLSKSIRLEDISLNNTPSWTCHVRCSEGLTVKNVTINADRTIANSDGFSIDCTSNVLIENCTIKTGDDSFALRASCSHHAKDNPCQNIRIKNCDIWSCCFAFRFGIGCGNIQNIIVENCRIHEAAESAFAFTPAWVVGKRNCHIQDISIKNCTANDCVRPATGDLVDNSLIDRISFENCTFSTLLPSKFSEGCGVSFHNCVRNTIYSFKIHHRIMWNERAIRTQKHLFITKESPCAITNCLPKPHGTQGVLILTFDDRNFSDWERALPLFEKYNAHATFFFSGEFNTAAIETAKKLIANGHSIGLHGRTHANVPEMFEEIGPDGWWNHEIQTPKHQAEVAYIPVHSFAYPNSRRTEETDRHIISKLERIRTAIPGIRPYDPEGKLSKKDLLPLVTNEKLFFPVNELPSHRILGGVVLGEAYNTEIGEVISCVKRAAERKEVIHFISHGISENAHTIHAKTSWIETILEEAHKGNMLILGFDELP